MAGHWRFLELSLPTPDIAASVDFYRNLGFTELPTTDARRYPYVVFTDGRIALGLHAGVLSAPALSFVQRDVASWARQLEAAGLAVEDQRLGLDDFHEFTLAGPAGHRVVVMEAATFSQPQVDAAPAPLTGVSVHIELGCSDLLEGIEFWRFAGLEPGDEIDADTERKSTRFSSSFEIAFLVVPGLTFFITFLTIKGKMPSRAKATTSSVLRMPPTPRSASVFRSGTVDPA